MMVWALAYPQLAQAGAADPVGCLGAGLILWASALSALLFHSSAQPDAVPDSNARGRLAACHKLT
jgi:hypothetical protein